jgi:hypothetical protein
MVKFLVLGGPSEEERAKVEAYGNQVLEAVLTPGSVNTRALEIALQMGPNIFSATCEALFHMILQMYERNMSVDRAVHFLNKMASDAAKWSAEQAKAEALLDAIPDSDMIH